MTSIGQDLKKEREALGMSLKDIADTTHVSLRYLEAVEADRWEVIPGAFYIKGVLRNYARAVGLDEAQVIARSGKAGIIPLEEPNDERAPSAAPRTSKKRTLSLAALAAVVLIILPFAIYFLTRPEQPLPAPEKSSPVLQIPAAAPPDEKPAPVIEPEETGLRMTIAFRERTWIQVYADGQLVLDGVKLTGDSAQVRAQGELLIHLGNAGGIEGTLNGKPFRSFGKSGAVVKNIAITPDNFGGFLQGEGAAAQ